MSFTLVTYRKTEDICVFCQLFAEMFVYYEETYYFWSGIFTLSKSHIVHFYFREVMPKVTDRKRISTGIKDDD